MKWLVGTSIVSHRLIMQKRFAETVGILFVLSSYFARININYSIESLDSTEDSIRSVDSQRKIELYRISKKNCVQHLLSLLKIFFIQTI